MASIDETKALIADILRLRRAERVPAVREQVAVVRRRLEDRLGPTLSRSRAATVLGVSQPTLERWVALGEIPTVVSPRGRIEVPRRFVIETAEELEHARRRPDPPRHPLSSVLHRRRALASRSVRSLGSLPGAPTPGHRAAELRGLAYHRLLADRLDPAIVGEARAQLDRLAHAGRIDPRYEERWRALLDRPLAEIAVAITADTPTGADLRQTSPFAGLLGEHERRLLIDSIG